MSDSVTEALEQQITSLQNQISFLKMKLNNVRVRNDDGSYVSILDANFETGVHIEKNGIVSRSLPIQKEKEEK